MKYISIDKKDFWHSVPAESGTYKIIALLDSKKPIALN